ncbi:cardiolipin synthase [Anoxybacillus pushchinoensis]|uniref:Cardiolipin synthase n=1 Tax=Anoxybacillus pushchinoensis TaxID=150248 RepID=A0A1I0SJ84_9BACL|nr:cardiolipin synthase [Anoxybacillus pushchinoensis]SFA39568.1 cardiolipin synthase [Anoxybacillus pushchinoensis]
MRWLAIILILLFLLLLDYKWGEKVSKASVRKKIGVERESNLTLFTAGEELFDDYFAELERAKHHIHILFYIVRNDEIGQRFFSLLEQKVNEGVEVRLLVDWVGSFGLPSSLRQKSGQFAFANRPTLPFFFYKLNERNHRKITVIDGKIGYLGGFNIGKEYIGQDPKFGNWRDYHLKIVGEGVHDLQRQFQEDWKKATGQSFGNSERYFPPLQKGAMKHRFLPTDGKYLEEEFIQLIKQAKQKIIIGTPYFIPSKNIMTALLEAMKRGVQLTIVAPTQADHPLVKEAAYPYFRQLLRAGAHIYQFNNGFYHAKVIVIDDDICDIGTANFDRRSLFINYEMNCYIYDKPFIQHVKQTIERDISTSTLLTEQYFQQQPWFYRLKEIAATMTAPLL